MVDIHEFNTVVDQLSLDGIASNNPRLVLKYLRMVRELKIRDSDRTTRLGWRFLKNHKGLVSEQEYWVLVEQTAIAALDVHAFYPAAMCVRKISTKFGTSSTRAQRLEVLYLEATAKSSSGVDESIKARDEGLEEQPGAHLLLKRKIGVEVTRGNLPAALDACRQFLDVYSNDFEVWEEYAHLALLGGFYRMAAFALEEVVMAMPQQTMAMVRYADTQYTIGGQAALKTAKTYYARVIEVTEGECTRALYGAIQTVGALLAQKVCSPGDSSYKLAELASSMLVQQYQSNSPDKLPLVKAYIKSQLPGLDEQQAAAPPTSKGGKKRN